jgi:hypothetical protein
MDSALPGDGPLAERAAPGAITSSQHACSEWRESLVLAGVIRAEERGRFSLSSAVELTAKNAKVAKKDSYEGIA